jgi:protein O-mannosyl-transferase
MISKYYKFLIPLFIIFVTFFIFYPSIENEFLRWDDNLQVSENKDIRQLNIESLATYFTSYYVGMYQPMTTVTYAIDYKIAGLNSGYFHFINILIHIINVLLVFFLFRKISSSIYLVGFVTLIFAIHPLQVESVSWLSARSNMMYTLFYLLALIKYIDYLKSGLKIKFLVYTCLFFILSLFSKSAAVTLPVLLFIFDYFYSRKIFSKRVILEKIPFFVASIIFGLITIAARVDAEHLTDISKYFNIFERFLLACYAVLFYLTKLIFPIKLSAFYNYPVRVEGIMPYIYYIAPFIIIGIAYVFYRIKKYRKEIIFGIGLFFIPILLVLQIIPVGSQTVTERYMYFPMLGLLFLFGIFVEPYITSKKPFVIALFILYSIFLGTTSFQRTMVWKDTMTLFDDTLEKQPRAMTVRNLRGIQYKIRGDYKKALNDFNLVIQYYPEFSDVYNNRANVKKRIGDLKGAIEDFDIAIEKDPNKAEIYSNKGIALAELGDINSAIQNFNIAVKKDPDYVFAYTNRAKAYAMIENYKKALKDIEIALSLDSEVGLAYFIRGMIKIQLQKEGACEDLKMAAKYKYFDAQKAILTYCK